MLGNDFGKTVLSFGMLGISLKFFVELSKKLRFAFNHEIGKNWKFLDQFGRWKISVGRDLESFWVVQNAQETNQIVRKVFCLIKGKWFDSILLINSKDESQ